MLQPKDTDWLNGYNNKTHICTVYKKPTSDLKTHRLKVRGWENIFHANGKQKKSGIEILISDKIDLKIKITRDKEGHYNNDQGINARGRHKNCKYLCTQHRSTLTHKTNINKHKKRN